MDAFKSSGDVSRHCISRHQRISSFKRNQNRAVFVEGLTQIPFAAGHSAQAADQQAVAGNVAAQPLVATCGCDRVVKRQIEFQRPGGPVKTSVIGIQSIRCSAKLGQYRVFDTRRRSFGRGPFQKLPQGIDLANLFASQRRDLKTPVRDHRHQAIGHEPPQRFVDRCATDIELPRQRDFIQFGAGRE
jgi:hypothetical protein